jgi:hypothetical protein
MFGFNTATMQALSATNARRVSIMALMIEVSVERDITTRARPDKSVNQNFDLDIASRIFAMASAK